MKVNKNKTNPAINKIDSLGSEDDKASKNGKFYLSGQKYMLTYKHHLDKADMEIFLEDIVGCPLKFFRAAWENGDEVTPYEHTHILVDFGKRFQTTDCRKFDIDYITDDVNEVIHPNIKNVGTKGHWEHCLNYLAKEDPANEDLLSKPNYVDGILKCKTATDAIRQFAKEPGQISGVLQAFKLKPNAIAVDRTNEFVRWQLQAKERFERLPPLPSPIIDSVEDWDKPFNFPSGHDRKIIVFHNPLGMDGKTFVCKQLMVHDPVKYFMVSGVAQMYHFSTQLQGAFESGWSGDTLLINLSRSAADYKIYDPLEAARDGVITSSKYAGKTLLWDSVNLVMMLNWMPNLRAMTWDRWEIYSIHPQFKTLVPMTYEDGLSILDAEHDARHLDNNF